MGCLKKACTALNGTGRMEIRGVLTILLAGGSVDYLTSILVQTEQVWRDEMRRAINGSPSSTSIYFSTVDAI